MTRERAHRFGTEGVLTGVVCQPSSGAAPGSPGVLVSNVGLNHHVGPNRVWVDLARRLAGIGFASLRFDLSGLGDSDPRSDGRSDGERAVLDMTEAMDCLHSAAGRERHVLIANCSGVDSLHATALQDERVAGIVPIDGYAYPNPGYWRRRRTVSLLQPGRWARRWRKYRYAQDGARREAGEAPEVWTRDIPTQETFAADLGRLLGRGVKALIVFSGGKDLSYNHRSQFEGTFGRRAGVEVEFYPRADHLFSEETERQRLLCRIEHWMGRHFGVEP